MKKTSTTVQISVEQDERIDAICHRTGISKKRVVRTLLDFALPTYEQQGVNPAVAIGPNATGANPGPMPPLTPPPGTRTSSGRKGSERPSLDAAGVVWLLRRIWMAKARSAPPRSRPDMSERDDAVVVFFNNTFLVWIAWELFK